MTMPEHAHHSRVGLRRTVLATAMAVAIAASCVTVAGCSAGDESRRGGANLSTANSRSSRPPDEAVIDPGDGGSYQPVVDPAEFVDGIDNPYFPLEPGTRWVYEGVDNGERERIELEATTETKVILDIAAVGVADINYVDGELAAVTTDWYSQDRAGNVWYLGEDTQNYENGRPTDTEGWEAGVDGALPGIFVPGEPKVGDAFRQNYQAGRLEELAEVVRVGAARSIGLGEYRDVIVIRTWTPLEPKIIEEKYYAPGVGKIYETHTAGGKGGTELVEHRSGRGGT